MTSEKATFPSTTNVPSALGGQIFFCGDLIISFSHNRGISLIRVDPTTLKIDLVGQAPFRESTFTGNRTAALSSRDPSLDRLLGKRAESLFPQRRPSSVRDSAELVAALSQAEDDFWQILFKDKMDSMPRISFHANLIIITGTFQMAIVDASSRGVMPMLFLQLSSGMFQYSIRRCLQSPMRSR